MRIKAFDGSRFPTAYAVADLAITGARLAGTVALAGVGLACVALYLSGSLAADTVRARGRRTCGRCDLPIVGRTAIDGLCDACGRVWCPGEARAEA